mmetsp:Transcript_4698/g.7327  ORF Transcript_4698/g.7327 Transcript_4698/m.7327 type:complete len:90 (+) Transcript_4698:1345-1614(+)
MNSGRTTKQWHGDGMKPNNWVCVLVTLSFIERRGLIMTRGRKTTNRDRHDDSTVRFVRCQNQKLNTRRELSVKICFDKRWKSSTLKQYF